MAAADGEIPSGGIGDALANQITETADASGIQVTVEVTRYGKTYSTLDVNEAI